MTQDEHLTANEHGIACFKSHRYRVTQDGSPSGRAIFVALGDVVKPEPGHWVSRRGGPSDTRRKTTGTAMKNPCEKRCPASNPAASERMRTQTHNREVADRIPVRRQRSD